ncbi:MAG: hypothetical protein E7544_01825 [Ruminococcaceae bacterium]|nr:hypothetical protein [Oscillospiraceae bacterium]
MKKLDKNTIKNLIIFAVVLVIYNVISFAIPFKHTPTFWGAYVFGTVAILLQIGIVLLAANGAETLRKKVYAFPVFRMGIIYLAVQLGVSLVFSVAANFIENFPGWIIYVVSVIILGVFIILVLLTDTAKEEIIKLEEEEERQTVQVKTFRINIDSIMRRVDDKDLLKLLEKLSDTAKYSDPVSCEELYAIESEITDKIGELGDLVRAGENDEAKTLTDQIIDLFEDRNAQCKVYKRR